MKLGPTTTNDHRAAVYNGSTWSTPVAIDVAAIAVSCASTSFCVAAGGTGGVVTFNGTTWSAPTHIDTTVLVGVSCSTSTFCVAVDTTGRALTYDGTSWSGPVSVAAGAVVTGVSCSSPTLCAVATSTNGVSLFNGASWSSLTTFDPTGQVNGIACGASRCTAVDSLGRILVLTTTWSVASTTGAGPLAAVSCPTTAFCAVVSRNGQAVTGTNRPAPRTTLTAVTWSVSDAVSGATGVTYTWTFTTGSTATVAAVSMSLPTGTQGASLTVTAAYGIDGSGATAVFTGTVVVVTVPSQPVSSGDAVEVAVTGFTNPGVANPPGTPLVSTSRVATYTPSGTPVDSGVSNPVTFTADTTQVTVTVPESLQFTNSAPNVFITAVPGGGTSEEACSAGGASPCPVVLGVKTNAANGYTVSVEMPGGLAAGASTFPQASTVSGSSTLATGTFGADVTATSFSSAGTGTASLGAPYTGGLYLGYTTSTPAVLWSSTGTTGDTADQVSLDNAANAGFSTPAGTYTGTIDYTANPNY
ncbi:MAG: hypothetical protein ACRDY1_14320 [Acidimicrobiales bacterium]